MSPRRLILSVLSVAMLGAICAVPAGAAKAPKLTQGPGGDAFYTPPAGALSGSFHGGVIWERRQTGPDALKGAARNDLVLYRSIGVAGAAVAVSGSVSVPKGKAPKGGWPVIAYDHGTSGLADQCAPTRDPGTGAITLYHEYVFPLLNRWLKAGYAVVRTDYEGLGTPGDHPYLIGRSEGRATLDIVRAARKVEPKLGKTIVISGHSQGGHAALWAASLASSWTPELKVAATVAFAPASHLSEQASLLPKLTSPGGGLSALAMSILRGIDVAGVGIDVPSLLSDQAAAIYPQVSTVCTPELGAADSAGGIAPASLVRSDADLAPLVAAIDRNDDPENLTLRTPVLIEQGASDTTVFPTFSAGLSQQLKAKGTKVTYKTYAGIDHAGIVTAAAKDATRAIAKAFKKR